MAIRQNIETLNLLLRDLYDPNLLFGGKIVVFGGDFRQTLPVVPGKSQIEIVESSLSQEFEYILLPSGNFRKPEDVSPNPITDLTSVAFPELDLESFDSDIFTTRAIITPLNEVVDAINDALIDKFPGRPISYKSYDAMLDDNCNIYPSEFINKLNLGGMSPHDLILKESCLVILLRNLQPSFGLCNGTRLICKRFYPNSVECVITTEHPKEEHVFIPRIKLRPAASANYLFEFHRTQFPLKLSFAMTINKCHGQTLSQGV
ncbi:uncharacterized protein LOC141632089 [Silene latifolia]|uniref:uncharacterized protein LOC141632089 n=1 Tax=Silene latifolia TaxID=37657 RepID=UPI003D7772B5